MKKITKNLEKWLDSLTFDQLSAEAELIKEKKSRLSASQRQAVSVKYFVLNELNNEKKQSTQSSENS